MQASTPAHAQGGTTAARTQRRQGDDADILSEGVQKHSSRIGKGLRDTVAVTFTLCTSFLPTLLQKMTAAGSPASSSDELGRLLEQELEDELETSAAGAKTLPGPVGRPRTPDMSLLNTEPLSPASIDTTLTSAAPVISNPTAIPRPSKRQKTDSVQGELLTSSPIMLQQLLRHALWFHAFCCSKLPAPSWLNGGDLHTLRRSCGV